MGTQPTTTEEMSETNTYMGAEVAVCPTCETRRVGHVYGHKPAGVYGWTCPVCSECFEPGNIEIVRSVDVEGVNEHAPSTAWVENAAESLATVTERDGTLYRLTAMQIDGETEGDR
jgi:hypothetical protein